MQSWMKSFYFTVIDGFPSVQCGIQLDLEDGPEPGPPPPHQQQHQQIRRRGPARRARDRQRAANHQAALAASVGRADSAAPAAITSKFPGKGNVVGSGIGPTLPLPLKKGDVFPPVNIQTPVRPSTTNIPTVASTTFSEASSESSSITTSSSTFPQAQLTPAFVASTNVRDELLPEEDSDDEDELLLSCGHCLKGYDSSSGLIGFLQPFVS